MLVLFTLFSLLGSTWAQTPYGPQIQLQAVLNTGVTVYVENAAANHFTYTTSAAAAAVFTLDQTTGFLYEATTDTTTFPSGYSVPAVTTEDLLGLYELTGYDSTVVSTQPGYYPLSCSSDLNLGLAQLTVPLLCLNEGLTNIVTAFGICANLGNIIVNYGIVGAVEFLLGCGTGSDTITSFNAVLVSLPPPLPSTSSNSLSVLQPTATGSCSVTVSLIVTKTTVYVPAGYTGPISSGSGGSTTGPNPYGCQPITSTLI